MGQRRFSGPDLDRAGSPPSSHDGGARTDRAEVVTAGAGDPTAPSRVGTTVGALLLGAPLGAAFVLAVGFLRMRADAAAAGVVLDLGNDVTALRNPGVDVASVLAVPAVAGLVLLLVVTALGRGAARGGPLLLSLTVGVAGAVAYAYALLPDRLALGAEGRVGGPALRSWQGWLQLGGDESAVHLVLLACVVALAVALRRSLRDREG